MLNENRIEIDLIRNTLLSQPWSWILLRSKNRKKIQKQKFVDNLTVCKKLVKSTRNCSEWACVQRVFMIFLLKFDWKKTRVSFCSNIMIIIAYLVNFLCTIVKKVWPRLTWKCKKILILYEIKIIFHFSIHQNFVMIHFSTF